MNRNNYLHHQYQLEVEMQCCLCQGKQDIGADKKQKSRAPLPPTS